MGLWQWIRTAFTPSRVPSPAVTLSVEAPRPIDEVILAMSGLGASPRIGRPEALSVPAVQRARNLICSLATLPLVQYGPTNELERSILLDQIDPDVPNVVTLSQTLEDLVFEGIGWWHITQRQRADNYPMHARRVDPSVVSLQPPAMSAANSPAPLPSGWDPRGATVWIDGREVPARDVIRFDSANPAVLHVAGRAIRRAVLLDQLAAMYADNPRPMDYFRPAPNADQIEDDEVRGILDEWQRARKARGTGYVPLSLEYNTVDSPSPADLQLAALQKQAGLDLSNALGVDPEELGISTTSRTYSNAIDRRRDRINDVLSPYMRAITDRLSMGDVTRRGYRVAFDLDDYMRANPTERWNVYKLAHEMGVLDVDEIRAEEGLPAKPTGTAAPAAPEAPPAPVESTRPEALTFDATGPRFTFDIDLSTVQFTVDTESRTVTGVAMPYNKITRKYGRKFSFAPGSLQWSDVGRVKLLRDHDIAKPLGRGLTLQNTPEGLAVKFSVASGPAGDEALALAAEGVLDGLSAGLDLDEEADTVPHPTQKGVVLVRRADLREVSLTAMPAYDDARVTKVAASRTEGDAVPEPVTPTAGPATAQPAAAAPAPAPVQFTAEAFARLEQMLVGGDAGPIEVSPHRPTPAAAAAGSSMALVNEALPYRFDRAGNLKAGPEYDFARDVISGGKGDQEALARAVNFMRVMFDVDKADAAAFNPNRQRPDMYVDQHEYRYPIWDTINKGTIADATPFVLPKFSSSSGLVSPHVEGVEPTPGTFVATTQTITPSAASGKVEITREAWDQGGNPQLSGIIWRQMVREWNEDLEASAVALLDAASPTQITLTAGGADDVLVDEVTAALAALQFLRGGFRMRDFFLQVDLYQALAAAKDADGRKLLPLIGPVNADGQFSDFFADLSIGGLRGRPAWALAATGAVPASSYLLDRNDVHGWATTPQRLEFQYRVAYVDVAIWGYKATAITDLTGVREMIYDPVA